ncbi:MAG TPA: hypothetical protein VGQ28_02850, partial [Thermoanaerobaculia bacterium]|nr:hypothetical protein [Thermoanaerobaculia bacterium]
NGPSCSIIYNVVCNGTTTTFAISVQQNYCSLEAGSITTTTIQGNVTLASNPGSYGSSRPGLVTAVLNCPAPPTVKPKTN